MRKISGRGGKEEGQGRNESEKREAQGRRETHERKRKQRGRK